jgi:hypothetical protein
MAGRGLLLLGFLAGVTGALGQGVLAPSSADFEKSTLAPSLPSYQTAGAPPPGGALPQTLGPLQLGPVDFHPHLLYQFTYGDGIPSTPTNHLTTAVQEISPGVLMNIGTHWTLDYTPTLIFYSNPHLADTTSHSASLNGHAQYEDWAFGLSQGFNYSDTPLVETAAQTEQTGYTTSLTASRQMGSHLSAQMGLNQNITSSSQISSSPYGSSQDLHSWVLSGGLNYQTEYKFGFGISTSAGYDMITPGSDMKFEQVEGTLNWQLADKLTVRASGGVEDTQIMGAQLVDPTFSVAINYQPFEQTSASLTASRSVAPSLFQDDVTVSTAIGATLRQRFFQKFNFEVSGGYSTTPFVGFATVNDLNNHQIYPAPAVASTVQQNRSDASRFVRVSVSAPFRQRGSISIFYSFSDYTSSLSAFALSSTQVGFEIGWHY